MKAWILSLGVFCTFTAAFGYSLDSVTTENTILIFTEGEVTISPSDEEIKGPWTLLDQVVERNDLDPTSEAFVRFEVWAEAVADDDAHPDELLKLGSELDPYLMDGDDDPLFAVTHHLHRQARDAVISLFDELCVVGAEDEEILIDLDDSEFRGGSKKRKRAIDPEEMDRSGQRKKKRKRRIDPVMVMQGFSVLCMSVHHFMPDRHGLPVMAKIADVAAQLVAYKLNKKAEREFLEEQAEDIFGGMSQEEFVNTIMGIALMVQKASREEAKMAGTIKTKSTGMTKEEFASLKERHRYTQNVHRVEPIFIRTIDFLAEQTLSRLAMLQEQV